MTLGREVLSRLGLEPIIQKAEDGDGRMTALRKKQSDQERWKDKFGRPAPRRPERLLSLVGVRQVLRTNGRSFRC